MHKTISFLVTNMKEMEIELRAQSIVLDALGRGIVPVTEIQDAVRMARSSDAMLAFVDDKYEHLRQSLATGQAAPAVDDLRQLIQLNKSPGLIQ